MNLATMEYFIALSEELSFTHAAERLHITQQTLSAHIGQLEKELGLRLVERTVPLKLTYAGEVFLGHARKFQVAQRSMEQEFLDIAGDERGILRVGIAATRGHIIMPRAIAAFRKKHPGITIDLHEGVNTELIEQLKAGDLDMIVAHVPKDEASLHVEHLYREEIVLVVAEGLLHELYGSQAEALVQEVEHSGDIAPLSDLPFLLVGRNDVPGNIARASFESAAIKPDVAVVSRNAETLLALVQRGVGACFTPGELVASRFSKDEEAGLRIIHLGDPGYYSISAAWKRTSYTWSVVHSFYKTLESQQDDTEYLPAHM